MSRLLSKQAGTFAATDIGTMVDSRKPTMSDLTSLEQRVERLEAAIDVGFAEQREYRSFAFERLRGEMVGRFDAVDARFNRLERKLDQFIDTQARTNALVERWLERLEPPTTRD